MQSYKWTVQTAKVRTGAAPAARFSPSSGISNVRICTSVSATSVYVTIHGTPSAIRAYSDHEGGRVKGAVANRLNFVFLGKRIVLIGHNEAEWDRPSFCVATILRTECPFWVKSRHCGTFEQCPLYRQKRTLLSVVVMSALCQKQTFRSATQEVRNQLVATPAGTRYRRVAIYGLADLGLQSDCGDVCTFLKAQK